jgi:alpha-ketoglutarate-dependent taurine dioxygenase
MTFEAVDLTPRIGSQVKLDKAALLGGEHAAGLRALVEQRGVLLFRGIDLSDEEEMALAATLGTVRQDFGRPIMRVTFDREKNPDHADYFHGTFEWHMDGTHEDVPPLASILTPRVLSAQGTGHTEFANTYASYADLSDADKARFESLRVGHSQRYIFPRSVTRCSRRPQSMSNGSTRCSVPVLSHMITSPIRHSWW